MPLRGGGEPVRVTTTPRGVRAYRWSPDFSKIAFTQLDPVPQSTAKRRAAGFGQVIFDEDFRGISLYVWDRQSGGVSRLTHEGTVFDFVWSPDSTRLAAAIAPRNLVDDSYMFKRIHTVSLDGKVKKVIDNPGKLGDMAWSPDGRQIAYISAADKRDPHAGMVYLVDVATGRSKPLTEDFHGAVSHIHWSQGSTIHAQVSVGVRTYVASIDSRTSDFELLTGGGDLSISGFSFHGGRRLIVASSGSQPAELFEVKGADTRQLTDSNPWLSRVKLGKQEIARITTRDGLQVEGLLLYPIDYRQGQRYPMVIVAHGGPESHFVDGWNTSYSRWGRCSVPGATLPGTRTTGRAPATGSSSPSTITAT